MFTLIWCLARLQLHVRKTTECGNTLDPFSVRFGFVFVFPWWLCLLISTEIQKPIPSNSTGTVNTIHVQSACAIIWKRLLLFPQISVGMANKGKTTKTENGPKTNRKRIQCVYTITNTFGETKISTLCQHNRREILCKNSNDIYINRLPTS